MTGKSKLKKKKRNLEEAEKKEINSCSNKVTRNPAQLEGDFSVCKASQGFCYLKGDTMEHSSSEMDKEGIATLNINTSSKST